MQQHHQSSRSSGSNKEQEEEEEEEEAIQPPPQRRQCKYNLDDPGDSQVGSIPENLGDKENFLSFAFFACFARRAQEENAFFGRVGKSGMRRGQQRRSGVGQKSRAEQKRGRKGRDPPSRFICILAINALKKPRTTTFPCHSTITRLPYPPKTLPGHQLSHSIHPSVYLNSIAPQTPRSNLWLSSSCWYLRSLKSSVSMILQASTQTPKHPPPQISTPELISGWWTKGKTQTHFSLLA
jgi:hypothetical protein